MSPNVSSSLIAKGVNNVSGGGGAAGATSSTSYHSTDQHSYQPPRASSGRGDHVFGGAADPPVPSSPAPPIATLNVNGGSGATARRCTSRSIDLTEYGDETYQSRPAFAEHLGKHRQYWRDIILGVNDGLVSTFLLVAGVAGGGLPTKDILLTAVAGALAGAVSMYAGEYVATKSQNEVLTGEIALENHHVREYRMDELRELSDLLTLIGLPDRPPGEEVDGEEEGDEEERKDGDNAEGGAAADGRAVVAANDRGVGGRDGAPSAEAADDDDADWEGWEVREAMMAYYHKNGDALLKIMVALEFGVLEEEQRSPCAAGLTSCGLFFLGSLPSVIPFAVVENSTTGLVAAGTATAAALFAVGGIKTWATRGGWLSAAVENFIIAGVGGAFAYGVGVGFDHAIREDS